MPNVTIPKEFFTKERDQFYSDWPFAFWRELIQNAVDAGASQISIRISGPADAPVVRFSDDGCGMDRETLENVFFRLGESAKKADGVSIGGFGRARLLTCFAQKDYEIRTGKLLVRGSGASYEIEQTDAAEPGCRFDIRMDSVGANHLIQRLKAVMETSGPEISAWLDVEVSGLPLTSEALAGKLTSGKTRRVLRDGEGKPFARLRATEEVCRSPVLIVRCRGLTTSSIFVPGLREAMVVDIEPARVREVLVGNRDSFKPPFSMVVDDVVADLSTNRRKVTAAEESELKIYAERRDDGGFLPFVALPAPAQKTVKESESASELAEVREFAVLENVETPSIPDPVRPGENRNMVPVSTEIPAVRRGVDHPVVVYMETPNRRLRRIAKEFEPENWTVSEGRGARILLAAWRTAVEHAIAAFQRANPGFGQINWAVGWHFDEDASARAVHKKEADIHCFLLSPVDAKGAKRYRMRDRNAVLQLLAIAQHEVAHIAHPNHDEDYAACLTLDIMANFEQKHAIAAISKAMLEVPVAGVGPERRKGVQKALPSETGKVERAEDPVEKTTETAKNPPAGAGVQPAKPVLRPMDAFRSLLGSGPRAA